VSDFKLVVTMVPSGDTVISEHAGEKGLLTVGRSVGNDVVLPDPEKRVSSRHAKLEKSGQSWHLTDLGSTNGTFLNDRRLDPGSPVEVREGDQIGVGLYRLKVSLGQAALEDQTLVAVDPARLLGELADELPALYARLLPQDPETRRESLKQAIRSAVSSAGPEQARSVLAQLRGRFHAGERVAVPERTTMIRRRDQEIQQREGALQAGAKALSELARRFSGDGALQSAEQVDCFSAMLGNVLELTMEWLSKSLKGRREFEVQFSADLSMIFSKEKNPLKGGGGPQELAKVLLDWRRTKDPKTVRNALDNAFKDLTLHQLGLLAGVQESLSAVLARLDPKTVEREAKEKGGGGMFSSAEKRAWKHYADVFQEIFSENSKLFNELIYPNVRKGYLALHSEGSGGTPPLPAPKSGGPVTLK
jgi:type VI secretion system FHA domain protein